MAIASVNVIQDVLTSTGWVKPGPAQMDAEEARSFAANGFLEILSVDGVREVFSPCCGSDH